MLVEAAENNTQVLATALLATALASEDCSVLPAPPLTGADWNAALETILGKSPADGAACMCGDRDGSAIILVLLPSI